MAACLELGPGVTAQFRKNSGIPVAVGIALLVKIAIYAVGIIKRRHPGI